jgi:hypothetical protein
MTVTLVDPVLVRPVVSTTVTTTSFVPVVE